MQWRVAMIELSGTNSSVHLHEVRAGGSTSTACSAATLGLTLADAKEILAGLQRDLVQAQTGSTAQSRRRCPRCGAQRPLKDRRPRRLRSLFGVVEVRAPRFTPCRCSRPGARSSRPSWKSCPIAARRSMNLPSPRWPEPTKRPDLTDRRTKSERAGTTFEAEQWVGRRRRFGGALAVMTGNN